MPSVASTERKPNDFRGGIAPKPRCPGRDEGVSRMRKVSLTHPATDSLGEYLPAHAVGNGLLPVGRPIMEPVRRKPRDAYIESEQPQIAEDPLRGVFRSWLALLSEMAQLREDEGQAVGECSANTAKPKDAPTPHRGRLGQEALRPRLGSSWPLRRTRLIPPVARASVKVSAQDPRRAVVLLPTVVFRPWEAFTFRLLDLLGARLVMLPIIVPTPRICHALLAGNELDPGGVRLPTAVLR